MLTNDYNYLYLNFNHQVNMKKKRLIRKTEATQDYVVYRFALVAQFLLKNEDIE